MSQFDSPSDHNKAQVENVALFAKSPDGNWIVDAEDLPFLHHPRFVRVSKDHLIIDGWVFPLTHVSNSLLIWLHHSVLRWASEDDSEANKQWLDSILDALMDALSEAG